ncbi:acetolactate decarboxylase [archaeon]|nr:MAG: acetolactate decarboxylase [archaeon]
MIDRTTLSEHMKYSCVGKCVYKVFVLTFFLSSDATRAWAPLISDAVHDRMISMHIEKKYLVQVGLLCLIVVGIWWPGGSPTDTLYQASTLHELFEGNYEGRFSYGDIAANGDFGLGTFEGLDGEMVMLEGIIYHVRADGTVLERSGDALTPFAQVTRFDTDITARYENVGIDELNATITSLIPDRSLIYAVRIDGTFPSMEVRSIARQDLPYRPLDEALEEQVVFTLEDVRGTIVGFWMPPSMDGPNAAGYHLHFITDDRSAGGHVLSFRAGAVDVALDETYDVRLALAGE